MGIYFRDILLIHNFKHSRDDYEHDIIQPWLPISQKYKSEGNKSQIPLIVHHNEKKQIIYLWCAEKDNWASQIREVALRKNNSHFHHHSTNN